MSGRLGEEKWVIAWDAALRGIKHWALESFYKSDRGRY